MPKINLLYIITKLELGGAQKQLLELIRGLDKEKYNIFLFTAKNGLLVNEALAVEGLVLKMSGFLERPVNIFKDLAAFFEIRSFVKRNKIQIVHTHSSKAGILGRLAAGSIRETVIFHTVHGWSFHDYQPKAVRYFYMALERLCANFTSKIIVVSNSDKEKGLRNSIGKKEQYCLIRYAINFNEFAKTDLKSSARRALGLNEADLVVGTVACFKPQKSPLDFINIAGCLTNEFPGVKFIMVGDGCLREKIYLSIKNFNLDGRITLTGWRNDVALILSAFDIFVLTSLWEGLPIAVMEAMAAGVPVVATDTGGIKDVIQDGQSGYLAKPKDNKAICERIKELLANSQKRDEFARLAKKRISSREFSLNSMVKNTEELYFNLGREKKNV